LLHHLVPVSLDGALGRSQLQRNLLVDLALDDKLEDLMFARRQGVNLGTKRIEFFPGTSHALVTCDGMLDRGIQLLPWDRLGQKIVGAGLDNLHRGWDVRVACQENDRQRRTEFTQPHLQLRTAQSRYPDIEQNA